MSDIQRDSITTIEQARDRLARAVSRAEVALEKRASDSAGAKDELAAALAAARAENESLRATNAEISARLDTAIGRLKAVMEEEA